MDETAHEFSLTCVHPIQCARRAIAALPILSRNWSAQTRHNLQRNPRSTARSDAGPADASGFGMNAVSGMPLAPCVNRGRDTSGSRCSRAETKVPLILPRRSQTNELAAQSSSSGAGIPSSDFSILFTTSEILNGFFNMVSSDNSSPNICTSA